MLKFFGSHEGIGRHTSGNHASYPRQLNVTDEMKKGLARGIDKISSASRGLFQAIKNPRNLAKAIFTKQNLTEVAVSAGVMAAAKAGVVAVATTLNAPLIALYAATVATGGVVGGFLRTWKDWQNSQRVANQFLAEPKSTIPSLRDEFARKAYQGYFSYAFENKCLLKNMAKSAFTIAAGGAIGVGLSHAMDAVSNLHLFAGASEPVAPTPAATVTPPILDNLINTDAPTPSAAAATVVDAPPKIRADAFAAKIKDVIEAKPAVVEAPAPVATVETPPALTTKELNERSLAAIKAAASGQSSGPMLDPAVLNNDAVTADTSLVSPQASAPALAPTPIVDTPASDLTPPPQSAAPILSRGIAAQPAPAPIVDTPAPDLTPPPQSAAPILSRGIAAQCIMGDDAQTVNCITRNDGKIGTGEKLRMLFGKNVAPTIVDFQNGDKLVTVPRFIERLRNFAPFEALRTSSAPVVTAQLQ
jgi:hypothetical protein